MDPVSLLLKETPYRFTPKKIAGCVLWLDASRIPHASVSAVAIQAAGSGYTANDVLTVSGGTAAPAATVLVVTVDGSGAVTSASVSSGGDYSAKPSDPVSVTGGSGTGATFNLTWTGLVDGDPVAQWDDLSGNGNHATQGTAAQRPTYRVGVLNGRPVVRFDGTDDLMSATLPATLGEHAAFLVIRSTLSGTDLGLLNISTISAAKQGITHHGGHTLYSYYKDGASHVSRSLSLNVWIIIARAWSGGFDQADMNMWVNGEIATAKLGTPGGSTLSNVVGIGGRSSTEGFLAGDYAEVIVYNRVLSTAERRRGERYLSRKWGIAVV